jgi:hypothetical protein|tara:strand:+ start:1394 stop:1642 length:249 start_codon:yes stop_codon:yes gene_type:complete
LGNDFVILKKKGVIMFYWTLFLVLSSSVETNEVQYVEIYTFKDRNACEATILKKQVFGYKHLRADLRCLKTDEISIRNQELT